MHASVTSLLTFPTGPRGTRGTIWIYTKYNMSAWGVRIRASYARSFLTCQDSTFARSIHRGYARAGTSCYILQEEIAGPKCSESFSYTQCARPSAVRVTRGAYAVPSHCYSISFSDLVFTRNGTSLSLLTIPLPKGSKNAQILV